MPRLLEKLAIVIGLQNAEGEVNTDVRDATLIANTDDGSPLSVNEALGISFRDESVSFDLNRIAEEGQRVTGSLSIGASSFNRIEAALSFDTTLKGAGTASPSSPGDWNLPEAVENLFEIAGLTREQSPTASGTFYELDEPTYATVKVWRGDQSWTLVDVRNAPSFAFTPGEACVASHTLSVGEVIHNPSDTFPTGIDYGQQLSLKAPILRAAGSTLGGTEKDWTDLTVSLDNAFSQFPSANSTTGVVNELDGRTVTLQGNFFVDSNADEDEDYQRLILETPPVDDLDFVLGETGDDPANALRFTANDIDWTINSVNQTAGRIVWNLTGNATSVAGDDEFTIRSQ